MAHLPQRVFIMFCRALTLALAPLMFLCSDETASAQKAAAGRKHYFPPEQISVMPVVFTPKGEKTPDRDLDAVVLRHLKCTQRRYAELLGTTFEIENKVRRVRGAKTLEEYRKRDGDAVMDFAAELLKEFIIMW